MVIFFPLIALSHRSTHRSLCERAPRETGCFDVGGCPISEVNKGDMESQGLYLSIFISHTPTKRDKNKKKIKKTSRS